VRRREALCLAALVLIALAIRLWIVWTQTYVAVADETFQYLEQAHRLAFGSGMVPWEFIDGSRSWLLPGVSAAVMRTTALLFDTPESCVRAVRVCVVVLSLAPVIVGFHVGLRREGLTGAMLSGGVPAIWFESVYFAPVVLTEMVAASIAFAAIGLGDTPNDMTGGAGRRRQVCVGALYGLVLCLRFHYVLALLTAAYMQNRRDHQRWMWWTIGAATSTLLLGGVLDAATWGWPFQSFWLNLFRNTVQGVSLLFGVEPATYFLTSLWSNWQVALLLLPLALIGSVRAPVIGLPALVIVFTHSLQPHKEYRFIAFALAGAPVLIGLGGATVSRWIGTKLGQAFAPPVAVLTALVIIVISAEIAVAGPYANRWAAHRAVIRATFAAHDAADLCGLAIKGIPLGDTGGYTYLGRDVPLYVDESWPDVSVPGTRLMLRWRTLLGNRLVPQFRGAALDDESARYNYVLAADTHAETGYDRLSCFRDSDRTPICLFHRAGSCADLP
jgi:GPI mannosyltransferase 3